MKQQIVVIGGGTTFDEYEDYISYLKVHRDASIEKFKPQEDWKDSLSTDLGSDYELFQPQMPNRNNARYEEWKIWFERMTPFINDDVVFIGHSLGGMFLAKYLSEQIFPKKIRATILDNTCRRPI